MKNPFENLKKLILLKEKIIHYVIFKIDNVFYALNTKFIKEIISSKEKKELPNTPDYIVGIINSNNPITLIDLKYLLKKEYQDYTNKMFVINFFYENNNYAFFTKEVIDIVSVEQYNIIDKGEEFKEYFFVDKTFSYEGNIVFVINIEKIFKKETNDY
ncbi:chemotaxis protein CheW [Marinitoga sp. 38H-ov]|uniref:chemotaxis protein CheW n=1 Tax=Marinitoga sp. 38H-ov TaxID=1755814 RepID=UPI0013EBDE5C|nr:chemotaxis protein CheW [Marinitoga sp. 38H-ov]KAF2956600.1 hypothetical protein AS160_05225 [Marinitoga sp. 38H-ov]